LPQRVPVTIAANSARLAAVETTMLATFPNVSAGAFCTVSWDYPWGVTSVVGCPSVDGGAGVGFCARQFACAVAPDAAMGSSGCERAWLIVQGVPVDCQVTFIGTAGERQTTRVQTHAGNKRIRCQDGCEGAWVESFDVVVEPAQVNLQLGLFDGGGSTP
jgi:hypothetical protein